MMGHGETIQFCFCDLIIVTVLDTFLLPRFGRIASRYR